MLSASGAAAESPNGFASRLFSPQELAFRLSYGIGDRESLRFYTFGPRVTYDLPDFVPPIVGNRLRIALEAAGSFIRSDRLGRNGEFALSPLMLDYRYDRGGFFVPFVTGGEGIVLTTLDDMALGGPFLFSSQIGVGFHVFITQREAISFDFRMRHISNAGFKDENRGLNTYFFALALSHFADRK